MTVLLDGNVLVALSVSEHVHHEAVVTWFMGDDGEFATTPITQGTLLRFLLRAGVDVTAASAVLAGLLGHARHAFWPDDAPYEAGTLRGVVGHRQVTDAYLAALVRRRGGRLATLDGGLATAHEDVVELVPVGPAEEAG